MLLRLPPYLYAGPLAELMRSRCVMLLTTRGRRTGSPRTTAVSFMPVGEHFVIFSGWGVTSGWYRNIRAHQEVRITVGRRHIAARAVPVEDPERRIELMRQMAARSSRCGPPPALRPLLKLAGLFDYEGEIDMALRAGGTLPVVEIVPSEPKQSEPKQ